MMIRSVYRLTHGVKGLLPLLLLSLLPARLAAQVTYQSADSITVCHLLQQAPRQASTLWFARHFLGVPYVAHTLEVNPVEQLVVNTREQDCTTFVETVVALTLCTERYQQSWSDYLAMLQRLRYRGGVLKGYTSRLHYFTDWIDDKQHMSLVKEIQEPRPLFKAEQRIQLNYMSRHPSAYQALAAHPEWVSVIRQQEQALSGRTYRYIPKASLGDSPLLRKTIHDGDIIAITCNKPGLDIAHLGFAVWQSDGLHLLNASMMRKKVVVEPMTLQQYLKKHPSHTGVRIIRITQKEK